MASSRLRLQNRSPVAQNLVHTHENLLSGAVLFQQMATVEDLGKL